MDLALNNQQRLIYYKNPTNHQIISDFSYYRLSKNLQEALLCCTWFLRGIRCAFSCIGFQNKNLPENLIYFHWFITKHSFSFDWVKISKGHPFWWWNFNKDISSILWRIASIGGDNHFISFLFFFLFFFFFAVIFRRDTSFLATHISLNKLFLVLFLDKHFFRIISLIFMKPSQLRCKIHRLYLCRGVRQTPTHPPTSVLHMTLNKLIARLQPRRFRECEVRLHCHCSQVHSDLEW